MTMHDKYAISAISYYLKGHKSTVLPELSNLSPVHKSEDTNNNSFKNWSWGDGSVDKTAFSVGILTRVQVLGTHKHADTAG